MDYHPRRALMASLPLAAILGTVSSHWDWSVGAVYAAFPLVLLPGALILLRGTPKRPPED